MHDQYDDKNLAVLKKLSTIVELPGFVKEASLSDEKELSTLPRRAFADPVNRKFPLASKKDVYLSSLYFRKYAHEYKDPEYAEEIKNNIDDALKIWNLPHVFVKKASADDNMSKEAAVKSVVVIKDGEGDKIDEWALNSPRDFEKAAIQLFENKNMFTFEQRKDIARQLLDSELKKTASLDNSIDGYLEKAAGFGICTKLQFVDTLRDRARLYKEASSDYMDILAEYAEAVEDEELDCRHLQKIAEVLDFMDKQTGVSERYKDLPSPEECLFVYTEKTAEEIKNSVVELQNGKVIDKEKISDELLDKFFDEYLGEIPQVPYEEKLDILASLPAPDADDFIQFYADSPE